MGDNTVMEENADLLGNGRIVAGCVDMGASEAMDVYLDADNFTLQPRTAGTVNFDLDFGSGFAGRTYIMLGTFAGVLPGFMMNGTFIPLNWDPYTDMVLMTLNGPIFKDFTGTLDGNGQAQAQLDYPGRGDPTWVGLTFHHVALTLNPIDRASNPAPITFMAD